ncbi:MAG: hypothetical protein CL845_05730 [Crocinitomicaceae bacterium]|nr:hypothetical protein [Crocinitomicaceae bacterium]|tara:strand:- start:311 stop:832 length:522 start_codon:yes stop_codon:yes gene_type:complete
MKRFIGIAAVFCCMAIGCGEPVESESLKEARELHGQLTLISGELHEAIQASLVHIEEEIEASISNEDSTSVNQLARLGSELGELDVRFHDWESTVVGIPGDACDHDHDHAHESGHEHVHDGDHAHNHANELSLDGMSDEEIREIQAALLAELQMLQVAYDDVRTELNTDEATE